MRCILTSPDAYKPGPRALYAGRKERIMSIANTVTTIAARVKAAIGLSGGSTAGYTVNTCRGPVAYATTATGAFRVLQTVPAADRAGAVIYDEDGRCIYR